MSLPATPFRIALVGAGRVGTAVTQLLRRSGHEVAGVASRDPASAQRAAAFLGAPAFDIASLPPADVVLVGAGDAAITVVAEQIVPRLREGSIVCHFAGSLGVTPLTPVLAARARACALHPVQACPDVASAVERLPGSAWGVTCDPDLRAWAEEVVARDLHGMPVSVAEEDRPLWHAAAVATSNGIAALLAVGESILASIGIAQPQRVLGPLAAGTVANAQAAGGAGTALTGPLVRGEAATIERHVTALGQRAPESLPAYLTVARVILEVGRRAGRVDSRQEAALLRLLEETER